MDDLIARIRAAMDEEERLATTAAADGGPGWRLGGSGIYAEHPGPIIWDDHFGKEYGEHIVRHDPARVLRQVAACRKILDLHQIEFFPHKSKVYTGRMEWPLGRWVCSVCSERRDGVEQLANGQACPTVLAIAEAYGIEVQA